MCPGAGDFDSREMAGWVRECFGGWRPAAGQPAQPLPVPTPPVPDQTAIAGKLFLVDIPGAAQVGLLLRNTLAACRCVSLGLRLASNLNWFPSPLVFAAPPWLQTSIAQGEVGIQLRDQDEFPLDVLTDVLNGFG